MNFYVVFNNSFRVNPLSEDRSGRRCTRYTDKRRRNTRYADNYLDVGVRNSLWISFKIEHSEIHWMISTGIMVRRWIPIQVDRWAEKVLNGKISNISEEQTCLWAPPQLPEKLSDRLKRVRNDPFQSQSDKNNFCFCIIWREMLPLLSMTNKTWF